MSTLSPAQGTELTGLRRRFRGTSPFFAPFFARTTGLSMHKGVDPWVFCDPVERVQGFIEEIAAESRALSFIPSACLLDVDLGLWAKKNGNAHSRLRISAITSEAGCPRLPSAA